MAENCRRKIQEVIGLMQKNLECSICLDMMNNPVSTHCGHQFCRFCLMGCLEGKKQVPCPLCKKMITKRSLMNRSQLGQMVDNVRSLIAAFQSDTGMLFSPPRGPHNVDLLPCTPDTIQAKIVTERAGKSTSALEKKMGKQRNTRVGRRKTLDNAEIGLNGVLVQSSSSGTPDRNRIDPADRCRIAAVKTYGTRNNSSTSSKTDVATDKRSELLQYIANGDHCSKLAKNKQIERFRDNEKNVAAENASLVTSPVTNSQRTTENRSTCGYASNRSDSSISFLDPTVLKPVSENANMKMSHIEVPGESAIDEISQSDTKLSNLMDTVDESSVQVAETGPLFQTPLNINPLVRLKRHTDGMEDKTFDTKKLRSRSKVSQNMEEQCEVLPGEEQLTPDALSESDISYKLAQPRHSVESKTYGKKGVAKHDKEAKQKVAEWLESVVAKTDHNGVIAVKEEIRGKKARGSKKDSKLKADEEKMGQKLKHLAENINTEVTDSCFGFDEHENNGLECSENVTEEKPVSDLDNTSVVGRVDDQIMKPEKVIEGTISLAASVLTEKNTGLDRKQVEDETKRSECTEKQLQKEIADHTLQEQQVQNTLLNKRRIFRTKPSNNENTSIISKEHSEAGMKKHSPETKSCGDIIEQDSLKKQLLYPGTENKINQDLPDSDPYEFKSSQNTPIKTGKKKAKMNGKKKNKKAQNGLKTTKDLSKIHISQSKGKSKSLHIHVEDSSIPCTQEEIKKISNKLDQAEDYDLLTCTQEAVNSIEDETVNADSDKYVAYPINEELLENNVHDQKTKLKDSQQKRVRFREPVISDFIQVGKIDILGYRKAKEKLKNLSEPSENDSMKDFRAETKEGYDCNSEPQDNREETTDVGSVQNTENTIEVNEDTSPFFKNNLVSAGKDNDVLPESQQRSAYGSSDKEALGDDKRTMNQRSPKIVFKNPMMTPTVLKTTSGVLDPDMSETMEDDVNSSGTDDLDIYPDEDQFEEPNIAIQPDDIKEKLSSQDLFVQNVLSTPQEGLNSRPSPPVVLETPAVFAVPSKFISKKDKVGSKCSKRNNEEEVVTVLETPLINVHDSLSQSLKETLPDSQSMVESLQNCDDKRPASVVVNFKETVLESSFNVLDKNKTFPNDTAIDVQLGPNETISPAGMPLTSNNVSHASLDTAVRNKIETELTNEHNGLDENSISLLGQFDEKLPFSVHSNMENNREVQNKCNSVNDDSSIDKSSCSSFLTPTKTGENDNILSATDESSEPGQLASFQQTGIEVVPKRKKKRKSFMLDEDDSHSCKTDAMSVSSPLEDSSKQRLKRKRLSKSHCPKSQKNSDTQEANVSTLETSVKQSDSRHIHSVRSSSKSKMHLKKDSPVQSNSIAKTVPVMDTSSAAVAVNSIDTVQDTHINPHDDIENEYTLAKSCESKITNMGIITISESVSSDISTIDPQNIEEPEMIETPCIQETNKSVVLNSSSKSTVPSNKRSPDDKVIICESSNEYSKEKADMINQCELYFERKPSQTESISMVPETEIVDFNNTPLNMDADILERKSNSKMEYDNTCDEKNSKPKCTEVDESQSDLKSAKLHLSKKDTQTKMFELETPEINNGSMKIKQRHISGMLVSPEETISASVGKGSPEDIFNMNSEMPLIDNSPMEETLKPVSLSEEETITDSMVVAQENKLKSLGSKVNSKQESREIAIKENNTICIKKITPVAKESNQSLREKTDPKNRKPDSDSESDLSQQERKRRKRRSGIKGARGFANRKKQSESSSSNSDLTSPMLARATTLDNRSFKHNQISEKRKTLQDDSNSNASAKKGHKSEASGTVLGNKNSKEIKDVEKALPCQINDEDVDLPDLSQRVNRALAKENDINEADTDMIVISNGMLSTDKTEEQFQIADIQHIAGKEVNDDRINQSLDDNIISKTPSERPAVDKSDDTSSSEFELSSSMEENAHVKDKENEEIDDCIKSVRNQITDFENTCSEIMETNSDNDSCMPSQEKRNHETSEQKYKHEIGLDAEVTKHANKETEYTAKFARLDKEFDTSSPVPKTDNEEPMEVLESDLDLCESDSDEVVTRKKSRKAVIADSSSDDEDESSRHMNLTSSSAFSSQSENFTTQDRNALERDLERMAREMESLKAQLRKGQGYSKDTSESKISSSTLLTSPGGNQKDVVEVEDDTDIDEMIEMDDSDEGNSDHDLFTSPPPLSLLSQNDIPAYIAETDKGESITANNHDGSTPAELKDKTLSVSRPRPALADIDINRPLSPGRKIPKAFVATGLTLHQVQEVKKLASLNDCKFYNKFNESVTHIIVKPAVESEHLCDRTLKLFQGIANKCWIVNYYWVVDSRHAGHLLPEDPYEIQGDTANGEQHQGPKKSRLTSTNIFDKFVFMCVGDCPGLSVDDMSSLIQTCGGELVPSVDLLKKGERTPLIVTCSDVEDDDGDVQISSQDVAAFNKLYRSHQIVTVSREWVLDSLTLYQLQPLKEYVVTSVKNMVVPKIHAS